MLKMGQKTWKSTFQADMYMYVHVFPYIKIIYLNLFCAAWTDHQRLAITYIVGGGKGQA